MQQIKSLHCPGEPCINCQIAWSNDAKCIFHVNYQQHVHQYNLSTNKWNLMMKFDPESLITFCRNENDSNLICIYQWKTVINVEQIINYNHNQKQDCFIISSKSIQQKTKYYPLIGDGCKIIYINDDIHIIGGTFSNGHYVFNQKTKQFQQIFEWKCAKFCLIGHKIAFINNNDKKYKPYLLLFGGCDANNTPFDQVYIFNINSKIWQPLNVKLPQQLSYFAAAVTTTNDFVIIVGGITQQDDIYSDNIYIYSIKNKKFSKSMIKAPIAASYQGIIINTINFNLMTVIKNLYNKISVPIPIFELIRLYCSSYGEYMYLFCYTTRKQKYYKIQVDNLFAT